MTGTYGLQHWRFEGTMKVSEKQNLIDDIKKFYKQAKKTFFTLPYNLPERKYIS